MTLIGSPLPLVCGRMPGVANGVGEGAEFYRSMAVAIIGGTITSTFLTLLVIPSFYDSIEISRDGILAKFRRREGRWNALAAFVVTLLEALATLVMLRFVWRVGRSCKRPERAQTITVQAVSRPGRGGPAAPETVWDESKRRDRRG